MDLYPIYATFLVLIIPTLVFLLLKRNNSTQKRLPLPPGSLGLPIIGQSLQIFRAMRANRGEDWIRERIRKYGDVSKLNVFGNRSVLLHGPAANKFIYTCDEKVLSNQQPASVRRLMGERNLLELNGEDHKRVRGAMLSFLKPEALRQSVGRMDQEIRFHLKHHWHGKHEILVMPLMKTLTFNVICSLIFGIERGIRRERLVYLFELLIDGMLALPINLPFTRFNRSLRARSEIGDIILELIREKRQQMEKQETLDNHQDLITRFLSMTDDDVANPSPLLSDEEIVDNCTIAMIAGHDTTSVLLTFLIKLLSEHPHVYQTVLNEQEEIANRKGSLDEPLTWEDLAKMKYTWKVATETLRMNPPIFCSFRRVVQDFELGGYTIPKGWQVFWTAFMTHMDESIYPDPSTFNPARFDNQGAAPPYSFMAFGGGPRMCPGYEFARIETLTMVHYLVTRFQWKLSLEENLFGRAPLPFFHQGLLDFISPKSSSIKKATYISASPRRTVDTNLAIIALIAPAIALLLLITRGGNNSRRRRLPPGSLGPPLIGQSLQLFRAMRDNRAEDWIRDRIGKYGAVSKMNVFGTPSVLICGPEANKFVYTCDERVLSNKKPASVRKMLGERNILELSGEDHKRVRGAMLLFLKPDVLKQSVAKMDEEIRIHLNEYWHGGDNHQILVMPLMKTLTFDVISTLIFGIERGSRRKRLVRLFQQVMNGMSALPINLPFTLFNKGVRARSEVRDIVMELIREKRQEMEKRKPLDDHHQYQDLITKFVSMKNEEDSTSSSPMLSDDEIVDNCIIAMVAGHDTSSVLLTFLVKLLSENPHIYENVLNEQEEIAKGKSGTHDEPLTWDDLSKMKYTWKVATEALRMYPPVFCAFKKVLQDFELGGYIIPKGWQIVWASFMTHMDESIYPDPTTFNPTRFDNKQGATPPFSYIAFGGGPRLCPGYELARIETLTMVHYMVTRFQWKLSLKENLFGRFPMPIFHHGLPIQVKIKKPLHDDHAT